MRIFTYWTRIRRQLELPDMKETVHVYGGSDRSLAEAERDAERRFQGVLERIRTGVRRGADYEADIREEILQRLNADNVVTRNRYGARAEFGKRPVRRHRSRAVDVAGLVRLGSPQVGGFQGTHH